MTGIGESVYEKSNQTPSKQPTAKGSCTKIPKGKIDTVYKREIKIRKRSITCGANRAPGVLINTTEYKRETQLSVGKISDRNVSAGQRGNR